jgi:hypothetical protein
MAIRGGPDIVDDGLVLALDAGNKKSYPGSGTTWTDLSGNGNNGTLVNGPTFDGANLGSISFDGVNDYVNGPSISSTFTGNMTAEAWIKVTASPGDWVRVVGTGNSNGASINRTFGLWYSVDRRLLWQRYGATDPSIHPTLPTLSLNTWHHVVATTSGTSHALYLDTISIGTATATGPWPVSNQAVTIGFAGFHTYTTSNISNVRLYNRALTPNEILQHFNATRSRFNI